MRSARLTAPGCIDIIEVDIPQPTDHQVRIKIEGCGICGSNIPVWEGREWFNYPLAPGNPGHEGWGFVDAVGKNVKDIKVGDRVTMLSYNAFAEYDISEADAVVKIPDSINNIPLPGEPLGCTINIFKRSRIERGDIVGVIGIGFLGSLLTQLIVKAGAEVIAISRREFSLNIAAKLGAHHTIKMDDHWRIIDDVKRITDGKLCTHVIEAAGTQWPLDIAGEITSVRGKLIVAGYHQDGTRSVNMQLWNWRGLDVINAHERDQAVYINGIRDAIVALENHSLEPEILYKVFRFEDINKAFSTAAERPEGFIKALVYM